MLPDLALTANEYLKKIKWDVKKTISATIFIDFFFFFLKSLIKPCYLTEQQLNSIPIMEKFLKFLGVTVSFHATKKIQKGGKKTFAALKLSTEK